LSFGAGGALFLLDVALVALVWPQVMELVAESLPAGRQPSVALSLLYPAAYVLFLYALGLYRRDALTEVRQALSRVPFAAGLAGLPASAVIALLTQGEARAGIPALFAAAVVSLSIAGCIARIALVALRRLGLFRRRLLIVGAGRRAWDLVWLLQKEGRFFSYEIAFVHGPEMGEVDPRLAGDPSNRILPAETGFLEIARDFSADQVVVAPDERRGLAMESLLSCRTAGFPVSEYLRFLEREIGRIDMKRIEFGWLLYSNGFGASLLDRAMKRMTDIAVSLSLLLLTTPFLLLAALVVKLEDGGPVLYRQARVTQDGRIFHIMKLRTMRVDAERQGATWAAKGDPRTTRIGRFLRRTRIDELPQLVNVLLGDMSFVGPRPERPEFTHQLAAQLPLYNERHRVKAGLTGWAQVNYPYGASLDDARSKLSYDLYYVKNFGMLFDLLIIIQTLRVVLWPGGGAR
jgi:sugar transferase (PEP-CTERM system associated)